MDAETSAVPTLTIWRASDDQGGIITLCADRRKTWLVRASVGLLLAGYLAAHLAFAHGDLHDQIASVTRQIQTNPTAELFLKRGELYRAHEERDAALKDFDRTAELDPTMDAVLLCRGQTLFEMGQLQPAKAALDQFLRARPNHADGHLSRARVLVALKNFPAATTDYDRAIALSTEPRPEFFVERARALMDSGASALALSGLDAGLKQLGQLPTLQIQAIEIELHEKHFDAALQRLDLLTARASRKETWLARRGDILAQAGRLPEARRAWAEALVAIELLPPKARNASVTQELETGLRQKAGLIARDQTAPNL